MVDLSNLKKKGTKKNRFGDLPTRGEVPNNLEAPEHAPLEPEDKTYKPRPKRKTGRTKPLSTRVSPAFYKELKMIAVSQDLKMVELLEEALEAYKEKHQIN